MAAQTDEGQRRAQERWIAQPGSQAIFLSCPVFEALYHGTRGPGKTDTLLMDFAQHCGKGFGPAWRGVLFRQTYPQLADVVAKSKHWYPALFGAEFNEQKMTWRFPAGEELLLRHFRVPDDYWNYHGHEYPWIGWEEITNWPTPECFMVMQSCSRSSRQGMPRKYRATTNPYGVGHNWVKARYRLPVGTGHVQREAGKPDRIAIQGTLYENKILLAADPEYVSKIRAAAKNPQMARAWLNGDWDIVAGGMLDDVWNPAVHVLEPFPIPKGWLVDRSFDWGSSKPFSVGWWAQSDGTEVKVGQRVVHTVRGDLYRIGEWYGCDDPDRNPNVGTRMLAEDIAVGIREREARMGIADRVRPGAADSSIFDEENGRSVAADMAAKGVKWERADKGPGSRKQGWEQLRRLLTGAQRKKEGPRESPGMFIFRNCSQWLRTVPVLPRSDEDLDDVDTEAEDHAGDETRYRARFKRKVLGQGNM